MKKFDYSYSILQTVALTNSDGTKIKRNSNGGIEINSWDQYLEDAIVPEITYTETNAVSVDKTVKAWTYYCDSLSGCVSGTEHYTDGDGSKENPWRSLKYALERIKEKMTCWRGNTCYCFRDGKYFQLKVKGTIDYDINFGDSSFRGAEVVNNQWIRQFIISPWGINKIVFDAVYARHIYGTIFNNIQLNEETQFYGSGDCVFNHAVLNNGGRFSSCHGTRFVDFIANRNVFLSYETPYQFFYNCIGSDIIGFTGNNITLNGGITGNLYNVSLTINDKSDYTGKYITGFENFRNCGFFNCLANVSGDLHCYHVEYNDEYWGFVDAVGFYGNTGSTFYNCTTTNQCEQCRDQHLTCRTPDF